MELFYTEDMEAFDVKLRQLIELGHQGHLPCVPNGRELRFQIPLYTSEAISQQFTARANLLKQHDTDAYAHGYSWRLEWRNEGAAMLKSMGMNIPGMAADTRLYRPQPILTKLIISV